jgi:hypothetical protein
MPQQESSSHTTSYVPFFILLCRLSRVISQRWQNLPTKGQLFYKNVALMDCMRYRQEMANLHHLQETETETETQATTTLMETMTMTPISTSQEPSSADNNVDTNIDINNWGMTSGNDNDVDDDQNIKF